MNDHYSILGVSPQATPEEIKKAYRSLANKHHPDKGGDQAVFKDVSVAYDTLSDQNKRAEYDQMRTGGPQVRFRTGGAGGFQDFNDIFGGGSPFGNNSPFGDIFGRQVRRNRDLNIQCQITLLDSFQGKQLEANYRMPSGRPQTVVINLPPGVENGDTIRYQGLGDDSIPQAPRGNLNVTIIIIPDPDFRREGNDLYTTLRINPIEAMIGCKKQVKTLTGETIMLDVRAGVETGTEYAQQGGGFANVHNKQTGRFITVISIQTPAVTDQALVAELKRINDAINKVS